MVFRGKRALKKRGSKSKDQERWKSFVDEALKVGLIKPERYMDFLKIAPTKNRMHIIEDFIKRYQRADEKKKEAMRSIFESIFKELMKRR